MFNTSKLLIKKVELNGGLTSLTNYTPTDILNFINELLKNDTNLVSVTMNPQNESIHLTTDNP